MPIKKIKAQMQPTKPETEQPYIERFITSYDGKKIYTRHYGDPANTKLVPIICLSGLVRTSDDFKDFAKSCADQGFYVVTMDFRGRGHSDFDENYNNYRGTKILADVTQVLNASHIDEAIFVGTSFGGILSMAMNIIQPNRVRAVIMNDIGPEFRTDGLDRIKGYVGNDHPQTSWDEAVTHLKGMFPTLRLKDEDTWLDMAKGTFKMGEDGLLHIRWDTNIAKTMGLRDTDPDLWRIFGALKNTPVLSIRGGVSDVLSRETFDKMAEVKPDLVRVEVEGVGHCPTFDEPVVLEKLVPFLQKVSAP